MKVLACVLSLLSTFSVYAFTIGAYNIRNFDYDERARIKTDKPTLANILASLKFDVLSVEEINNTKEFENFLAATFPFLGVELSRCGGAHGQQLGFIYNKNTVELLAFQEDMRVTRPGTQGSCDGSSRPLAIGLFRIRATGQKFHGMTAHLKAGSTPDAINTRNKQYAVLRNIILELRTKTGVPDAFLAGDLNTTEFLSRGSDFRILTDLVKSVGMVNLTQNATCSAYWWGGSNDGIESPSLLDHVIVTPGLVRTRVTGQVHGHCQRVNCKPATPAQLGISYQGVSDHCPVTMTIQ